MFELVAYWHMVASYETFDHIRDGLLPEQFVLGETRLLDLGSLQTDYMKYIIEQRSFFGLGQGNGTCEECRSNELLIQQLVVNFGTSIQSYRC